MNPYITGLARMRELPDQLLAPSLAELTRKLSEMGAGLAAACVEFVRDPRPDSAETLVARFHSAARFAMQVDAALMRERQPNPPIAA